MSDTSISTTSTIKEDYDSVSSIMSSESLELFGSIGMCIIVGVVVGMKVFSRFFGKEKELLVAIDTVETLRKDNADLLTTSAALKGKVEILEFEQESRLSWIERQSKVMEQVFLSGFKNITGIDVSDQNAKAFDKK